MSRKKKPIADPDSPVPAFEDHPEEEGTEETETESFPEPPAEESAPEPEPPSELQLAQDAYNANLAQISSEHQAQAEAIARAAEELHAESEQRIAQLSQALADMQASRDEALLDARTARGTAIDAELARDADATEATAAAESLIQQLEARETAIASLEYRNNTLNASLVGAQDQIEALKRDITSFNRKKLYQIIPAFTPTQSPRPSKIYVVAFDINEAIQTAIGAGKVELGNIANVVLAIETLTFSAADKD